MAQKEQIKHVDNINVNEARTRSRDAIQSLYAQAQDIVKLGTGELDKKLLVQAQEHFIEWRNETNLMSSFFGALIVFLAVLGVLFLPFAKHLTDKLFLIGFIVFGVGFFRYYFSQSSSQFSYVRWALVESVREQIFIDGLKYEIFKGAKFYKFNLTRLCVMVGLGGLFLVASALIQFNVSGLAQYANAKVIGVLGAFIFTLIAVFRFDQE